MDDAPAYPSSGSMLLDRFSASELDFSDWFDAMVAEGRLYRPNATEVGALEVRSGEWWIRAKNVGCAVVAGNRDSVHKTQEHFCDFVQRAENMYAKQLETDVANMVCEDSKVCKLGLRGVFDYFSLFKGASDVTAMCHDMFDVVNQACPDGGVADMEVGNDADGSQHEGQLESAYTDEDPQSCQSSDTTECYYNNPPE